MALRYLKIAKADGSGSVTLMGSSLKLPDIFPEIRYMTSDKAYQMRTHSGGPGNLVHKSLGSNINHAEISFTIHNITNAEMNLLNAMYQARPNVVMFSNDSGVTRYYCKFKENGFVPEGYRNNENPATGLSYFLKANVDLIFLQVTTNPFT